jgi:hypothetical protein
VYAIVSLILLLVCGGIWGQSTKSLPGRNTGETPEKVGKYHIWTNPIGIFTLGPTIGAGVRLGNNFVAGMQVRFLGVGLIMNMVTRLENYDESFSEAWVAPYNTAIGTEFSYLIPCRSSADRIRVGLDMSIGLTWIGEIFEKSKESWTAYDGFLLTLVHAGYRWRFPSGFFVELGGRFGIGVLLWSAWWYDERPDEIYRDDYPYRYPIGSFDLVLGIELMHR